MAKRDSELAPAVTGDRYVRGRIRALVLDLVSDDWSMALRDLERLYRALKAGPSADFDEPTRPIPEVVGASIYYDDDGTTAEEFCQGPDERGNCPRAEEGRPVACAGKRLATRGWDVGIATDAEICPLLTLGLVKRYLEAVPKETKQTGSLHQRKEVEYV